MQDHPAYAGKSPFKWFFQVVLGDHPRVCGEKGVPHRGGTRCRGSPPRMRGKVPVRGHSSTVYGITPAYAGKSFPPYSPAWKYRITPAYAGKSSLPFPPRKCCRDHPRVCGKRGHGKHRPHAGRDHPRVCGEKLKFSCPLVIVEGSPPRMRGKVGQGRQNNLFPGITPAYAGKSCFTDVTSHRSGDHPAYAGKSGNSVKTLTTPRDHPAYAGKSSCHAPGACPRRDHPRVCGEKPRCKTRLCSNLGSPPRMRGKDLADCPASVPPGITPAYAGKRHKAA